MSSDDTPSDWRAETARYEEYLAGPVADAWARCLPVWSALGRVNEVPRGVRPPRYLPSFAVKLGCAFVRRFVEDYSFLLDRFEHGSPLESACAFDLLDFLAGELHATCAPFPEALRTSRLPLPPYVLQEMASDWIYRDHGLLTLGQLLAFEYHGQKPCPA